MTESRAYTFDTALKIWITPFHDGIGYSDGDAVEHRLLEELRKCRDLSAASEELRARIADWPSEYHLSPVRHNLLRPFEFKHTDFVLELGCGCGAMTRYLGETGATVIAVEGSRRRAAIASERCRDLPNVSVYCENLVEFKTDRRFDFVTLIGVLEYSRLFISGEDPVQICLEKSGNFLVENGSLVLAIENQFGIKYFSGCREDHTGVPFFGINDLYSADTPVTFGRRELADRLGQAGLICSSFFYPFPDYKLPNIILAESAFNTPDFNTADLLFRSFGREYGASSLRSFQECMVWQPLARNNLIQELANSFLVVARKTSIDVRSQSRWLARVYSSGRLANYTTETVFVSEGQGCRVQKKLLYSKAPPLVGRDGDLRISHQVPLCSDYVIGRHYSAELQSILAHGGGGEEVALWAAPWVANLIADALIDSDHVMLLPGARLDSIPLNFVRDSSDALVEIDREWVADVPVPFTWILIRGLVSALAVCPLTPAFAGLTFKDGVKRILLHLGQNFSENDFQTAAFLEDSLQQVVCGRGEKISPFSELLAGPICSFTSATTFHQEFTALNKEIARIKASASWRVTKPLRFMIFVIRRGSEMINKLIKYR